MKEIQEEVVKTINKNASIQVAPASFFPVFTPLFQVFALLPATTSFLLWTLVSLLGTFFYLRFLFKDRNLPGAGTLALTAVLAYHSFSNLFWGQLSLLLVLCVGEFIRNAQKNRDFHAGLWIGGLILKPQLLILIGFVFLIQRKWKMLAGCLVTMLLALGASLAFAGLDGLTAMLDLLLKYSVGLPTNAPEYMMNWRMLGELLDRFAPRVVSAGITIAGMAITSILSLWLWRRQENSSSTRFLAAFTGTLAATLVVTWHSHTHMGMVLLPGLFLLAQAKVFSTRMLNWWLYFIPLILLFIILPLEVINLPMSDIPELIPGVVLVLFNLVILGWAWKSMRAWSAQEAHV